MRRLSMVDIHCHLIPGVDDGPQTMEAAIALCRECVADGITHAICTSHIHLGRYNNSLTSLIKPFSQLQRELSLRQIDLKLGLSAEVRLDVSILQLLQNGEIPLMNLRKGETVNPYILLELPDAQIPLGADKLVKRLMDMNITPIIAHPERNKELIRDLARVLPFLSQGCKLQITAGSLIGQFGSVIENVAWQLLESGYVIAVASDAHNLNGRSPKMAEARHVIQSRLGEKMAETLTFLRPSQLFEEFDADLYA